VKRSTIVRLAILGVVVAALVAGTSAFALANSNGATVTKDAGCALSQGASGLTCDLFTNEMIEVDTHAGTTSFICHFDIPAGCEPAKAIKNTGFSCGTYAGGTTDTQSVVSPGGKAVLICQIKP